jgi:glycosyltransferase involved in cell wall biosynthesis
MSRMGASAQAGAEPRVSVVVPLYNHEQTVEAALDSILMSDTLRVELIVGDDASRDRSLALADSWLSRNRRRFARAELIANPKNLGINGNLNLLTRVATGQYITLLASDDELAPMALDRQADCLDARLEWDYLFANCALIDEAGAIVSARVVGARRARMLGKRSCALVDLVFRWYLPWNRLFARRVPYLGLGPYAAELAFEDRWAALKIAETRRFGYLHEVVHNYRLRSVGQHTPGLSHTSVVKDLLAVEAEAVSQSTGLLRVLIAINSGAYVRGNRWSPVRLACRASQACVVTLHRALTAGD